MQDTKTATAGTAHTRTRTRAREAARRHRPAPGVLGDEGELMRRYSARLERAVRRMAPWAPGWLIEEGCGHAWEQLLRYQPERGALLAWLRTVAYHEVLRLQRHKTRERSLDAKRLYGERESGRVDVLERIPRLADPHDIETALEAREALRLLAGLRWRRRRVLELRLAGYSYQEIAGRLGVTYTNVNRHVTEGRAELRGLRDAA